MESSSTSEVASEPQGEAELLPCPAGHNTLRRESDGRGIRIICDCGWQGPITEISMSADELWNTRASRPADEVEAATILIPEDGVPKEKWLAVGVAQVIELRERVEELKRSVDCVCGHHQHRSDGSTGAARECLECDCKQFCNVHMAYESLRSQLAEARERINELNDQLDEEE